MIERLIEQGEARITVHRATYRSKLLRFALLNKLSEALPEDDPLRAQPQVATAEWNFYYAMSQTSKIEGLDFTLPTLTDPPEQVLGAFEEWLDLDEALVDAWLDGLVAVQRPLSAPEVAPSVESEVDDTPLGEGEPLVAESARPTSASGSSSA